MLRKPVLLALLMCFFIISPALADNWTYTPLGGVATELTGGYGAVGNPANGSVYGGEDFFGDFSSSYAVIIDSGSSGFLMSKTVQSSFGIPLQNGTYSETGIGGSEQENITQPLTTYFGPPSLTNPDNTSTLTAYGTYTYEARQSDPIQDFIFFDIIGTPMIQNKVMVVTPSQSYDLVQGTLGFLTAQTVVQSTAPVLPVKGTYHVPVTWTNFISGPTVPTEGLNPVITGVTARGPSGTNVANNWLLDTGSQFTIISPTYATALGIDLSDPLQTVQGQGVGGATVNFDEFQISEIALPLSNGDRLVFKDAYVFVPEGGALPAGLTGIIGENLLMQSADSIDQDTGLPVGTHAPLFAEWYLDGPGGDLVLYDPNSAFAVPEPSAIGVLGLGCMALLVRGRGRRAARTA